MNQDERLTTILEAIRKLPADGFADMHNKFKDGSYHAITVEDLTYLADRLEEKAASEILPDEFQCRHCDYSTKNEGMMIYHEQTDHGIRSAAFRQETNE